ncbi:uncharacterized protein EAE97_011186 [Botrytis byssoidea]|uniref:Uncharacterized protein n=1 Tax=Botrytis byssoidea TaxID=139641 RepID=A0A9P5LSW1_9HELO|nr:uncharacterized protein EAE97_011186 [Botrytis byssoidea]KAF7921895.1 hypothetical protein EAE97_011186 [Botrytis byssoidea]
MKRASAQTAWSKRRKQMLQEQKGKTFESTTEGMRLAESPSIAIPEALQQPIRLSASAAKGAARLKRNASSRVAAVDILGAAARIGTAYTQASIVVDAADTAGITDTSGGITHGVDEDSGEVVDTTGMNVGCKGDICFREDYGVMYYQEMGLVLSLSGWIGILF